MFNRFSGKILILIFNIFSRILRQTFNIFFFNRFQYFTTVIWQAFETRTTLQIKSFFHEYFSEVFLIVWIRNCILKCESTNKMTLEFLELIDNWPKNVMKNIEIYWYWIFWSNIDIEKYCKKFSAKILIIIFNKFHSRYWYW